MRMDRLTVAAVWCVLFGFYLLCAGTISADEIGAGLVLSTLATAFMGFVQGGRERRLRIAPPARVLGRPLLGLVTDSVRVGAVLLRAIRHRPDGMLGEVARQPFRQGGETPADAGRRGLVILSASLAPNGYALHIPDGEDVLVMHRLVPVPPSPDRDWPA